VDDIDLARKRNIRSEPKHIKLLLEKMLPGIMKFPEKCPDFLHKMAAKYEISFKKHIITRYSANNRIVFVLYLTFVHKMMV